MYYDQAYTMRIIVNINRCN